LQPGTPAQSGGDATASPDQIAPPIAAAFFASRMGLTIAAGAAIPVLLAGPIAVLPLVWSEEQSLSGFFISGASSG